MGTNTNLGILLLCVPLAKAAESTSWDFRKDLTQTLNEMDAGDARDVFAAIRLTNPGGLGSAEEHDVRDEPTVSLVNAMAMAADRDMIARQYANGFDESSTAACRRGEKRPPAAKRTCGRQSSSIFTSCPRFPTVISGANTGPISLPKLRKRQTQYAVG
ncbi:hypothetical protein AJ87_45845 [Rhizobium yanglingense]|nr:hypothetical protein AJ87_45845 [Rhizobium yanglingense]